jgi:hypothetical protein
VATGTQPVAGLVAIGLSLIVGIVGYYVLEPPHDWLLAFSRAAMILSGMGPYDQPQTPGGLLFAGIYALYSGLLLVGTSGIILAPIFHRVLYGLHAEDDVDEKRNEKRADKQASKRA